MTNIKQIKDLYYNAKTGYVSADKLWKKAKELGINITKKQVSDFLNKQYSEQITKQLKRPKKYSTIVSPSVLNNFQINILIYDRYEFHHYKYILMVIDVYSRYLQAIPLTSRKFDVIMKKLVKLFEKIGYPKNINVDNEFNTNEFNKFVDDHNIKVYYSDPNEINKNAIVERCNRTIASMLQK